MSDEDLISMRDPEYVGRGKRIHELKARIAELEAENTRLLEMTFKARAESRKALEEE